MFLLHLSTLGTFGEPQYCFIIPQNKNINLEADLQLAVKGNHDEDMRAGAHVKRKLQEVCVGLAQSRLRVWRAPPGCSCHAGLAI